MGFDLINLSRLGNSPQEVSVINPLERAGMSGRRRLTPSGSSKGAVHSDPPTASLEMPGHARVKASGEHQLRASTVDEGQTRNTDQGKQRETLLPPTR